LLDLCVPLSEAQDRLTVTIRRRAARASEIVSAAMRIGGGEYHCRIAQESIETRRVPQVRSRNLGLGADLPSVPTFRRFNVPTFRRSLSEPSQPFKDAPPARARHGETEPPLPVVTVQISALTTSNPWLVQRAVSNRKSSSVPPRSCPSAIPSKPRSPCSRQYHRATLPNHG
jgi:hypothetical protein